MPANDYFSEVLSCLSAETNYNIEFFDTVESTNTYLKRRAYKLNKGIVIADRQSSGRGRSGKSFYSPPGSGIYLSFLFRPTCPFEQLISLTCCAAVEVRNAIFEISGISPDIKWVNDLIVGTKKVCGILTESVIDPSNGQIAVIIGVGVNVNHDKSDFPDELKEIASSLALETGKQIDRAKLTAEIIKNLEKMCANWPENTEEYLDIYRDLCISVNKDAVILKDGQSEQVYAESIDDNFGLIIRHRDGRPETIRSGEVSVRGLCGYI